MVAGAALEVVRRLTAAEFREDTTRGEAADRAVAPFAMGGDGGVGEADIGRRDESAVRAGAVVAMDKICGSRLGWVRGGGRYGNRFEGA